jgi:hypothetical protein
MPLLGTPLLGVSLDGGSEVTKQAHPLSQAAALPDD